MLNGKIHVYSQRINLVFIVLPSMVALIILLIDIGKLNHFKWNVKKIADTHTNNLLTSYHFTIATDLKRNRNAGIDMEKYDILVRLRTLRMRWAIVLMLESRTKMKDRLHDWPRIGICLNRNRCCCKIKTVYS